MNVFSEHPNSATIQQRRRTCYFPQILSLVSPENHDESLSVVTYAIEGTQFSLRSCIPSSVHTRTCAPVLVNCADDSSGGAARACTTADPSMQYHRSTIRCASPMVVVLERGFLKLLSTALRNYSSASSPEDGAVRNIGQ